MMSSAINKRGFTLVELLTVVVIIAIIAALAVPALKTIQSTALQGASRQVSNALQLARQYAITHRTNVRFLVAVDTSSGNIRPELICRAYTLCEEVQDADGNILYWAPIQDWRLLPDGVVFSDLVAKNYAPKSLSGNLPPPLGQSTRTISDTGTGSLYFNNAEMNSPITNSAGTGTVSWNVSYIEFGPSGLMAGSEPAAIRLMQGSVLDPTPPTPKLLITDTNNWVYVETDPYAGRVRVRNRDSYQ